MPDKRRKGRTRGLPAKPSTGGSEMVRAEENHEGVFPSMINTKQVLIKYMLSAVIMWIMLIVVSFSILSGTAYWDMMWKVLAFGASWATVIVPATIFRNRYQNSALRR